MTTWATRLSDIRDELQETTAGFWSDAALLRYGNRAYQRIIRRLRVEKTSTLTLVVGTEAYSLPTDFYLARRVELQTQAGSTTSWQEVRALSLDHRRPGDPLQTATLTAIPTDYYIFADQIHFVPQPDQAYSGTLYYYRDATSLTLTTSPLVYPKGINTEKFDEVFDWYVCAMALRKRQDPAYTTYLGDYAAGLNDLVADSEKRGQAKPLIVSDDWESE